MLYMEIIKDSSAEARRAPTFTRSVSPISVRLHSLDIPRSVAMTQSTLLAYEGARCAASSLLGGSRRVVSQVSMFDRDGGAAEDTLNLSIVIMRFFNASGLF